MRGPTSSDFYLNNPNLKRAGVPIEWTPELLVEYARCAEDPIYFIRKYIKVVTIDRGLVNFELYDFQQRFVQTIHDNRFVIGMFPRQAGKTTTVAAYITWYVLFNNDKTVALLANKAAAAREIMSRIQLMIENLPLWMQQGVIEWNKGSIAFENNSKVFTSATSASGIRGRTISLLVIDECAIIPNTLADEFFASTYPVISSGRTSKIVMTSTPLGLNHFWKFWREAEAGINGFIPVRVHWHEIPGRDQSWYEEQLRLLGETKFKQEVECEFIGSALTLLSAKALMALAPSKPLPSSSVLGESFKVYRAPLQGAKYVVCVDPSEGVGGDYSAISVIEVKCEGKFEQVAAYRDNAMSPQLLPNVVHKIAQWYNEAFVLVESNKAPQVAYILHHELEYPNMVYVYQTPKGQRLTGNVHQWRLGVNTDKKVKRIGCMTLKDLIETGALIVNDSETIAELHTFIERGTSYAADDGKHDDMVMTLVLFAWLINDELFLDMVGSDNVRKKIFDQRMREIEEDVLPFGYIDDGVEYHEQRMNSSMSVVTHDIF